MSLSRAAAATRYVLKEHKEEALNGKLTIADVVGLVREVVPGAREQTIYRAIEDYGPIGEGDVAWMRRAELPRIPGWFYNPRTGEPLG